MIANGMLLEFIYNLIDQVNEDKLWQLYLAVALIENRPYNAWKAEILKYQSKTDCTGETDNRQELTPEEAVVQAEGILSEFKPF